MMDQLTDQFSTLSEPDAGDVYDYESEEVLKEGDSLSDLDEEPPTPPCTPPKQCQELVSHSMSPAAAVMAAKVKQPEKAAISALVPSHLLNNCCSASERQRIIKQTINVGKCADKINEAADEGNGHAAQVINSFPSEMRDDVQKRLQACIDANKNLHDLVWTLKTEAERKNALEKYEKLQKCQKRKANEFNKGVVIIEKIEAEKVRVKGREKTRLEEAAQLLDGAEVAHIVRM